MNMPLNVIHKQYQGETRLRASLIGRVRKRVGWCPLSKGRSYFRVNEGILWLKTPPPTTTISVWGNLDEGNGTERKGLRLWHSKSFGPSSAGRKGFLPRFHSFLSSDKPQTDNTKCCGLRLTADPKAGWQLRTALSSIGLFINEAILFDERTISMWNILCPAKQTSSHVARVLR